MMYQVKNIITEVENEFLNGVYDGKLDYYSNEQLIEGICGKIEILLEELLGTDTTTMNKCINEINDVIQRNYGNYDTDDLENIIEGLVASHIFTSKDSINNLIQTLENLKENY